MSAAQPTPDALSTQAENELICEKLLGWEKVLMPEDNYPAFKRSWCHDPIYAPSFTTWPDAGLLLEALAKRGVAIRVGTSDPGMWGCWLIEHPCQALATTAPNAVRAAALEYIRSLP